MLSATANEEFERLDAGAVAGGGGTIKPASHDAKNHTIDILMVTGERVPRWYGFLELSLAPDAIDLSRVTAGKVHVFDSHNTDSIRNIAGNVLSVRFDGGVPVAKVKFAQTELGQLAEGMMSRGELTGASIGFAITSRQKVSKEGDAIPVYRAVKWQLQELSLTGIPAVASAGALTADTSTGGNQAAMRATTEGTTMQETAPDADALRAAVSTAIQTERVRVKAIRDRTKASGLPAEVADKLIDDGVEIAHVGDHLVDEMAARHGSTSARFRSARIEFGTDHDDPAAVIERISTALAAKITAHRPKEYRVEMAEDAREFANYGILDGAAEMALRRGHKLDRHMPRGQLYSELTEKLSLSTSDFPLILASAANKMLLPAYQQAAPTYKRIFAQKSFNDFKAHHFLRAGDFPVLLQKGETGELKYGALSESDQQITAAEYGRILRLSRKIIINDDLGAFAEIPSFAGRRAAAFENTLAFNQFALNSGAGPGITESGTATYLWDSATHANYTSSGTAISVASLGIGEAAMLKQKSLDGMLINTGPRFLLTAPDQTALAKQFCSPSFQPNQSSAVNPYAGVLEPLVDANLTGTAWYLFADPARVETFIYGYLAGQEGPRFAVQQGFETEGIDFKLALDIGVGAVDFRGTYKNAGT